MKFTHHSLLIQLIAATFILLFVYTAVSKLLEMTAFHNTIQQFPLLKHYSLLIAWGIPVSELFISTWLFFPITRVLGFYAAFGLMTIFTLYIAYALIYGNDLPCSCGGVLRKMTWTQHLFFNIFFTLLAAAGILLLKKYKVLISRRSRIPV